MRQRNRESVERQIKGEKERMKKREIETETENQMVSKKDRRQIEK